MPDRTELERPADPHARRAPGSPTGPEAGTPSTALLTTQAGAGARRGASSRGLGPAAVLAMQRFAGNRAVVARLRRPEEDAAALGGALAAGGETASDDLAAGEAIGIEAPAGPGEASAAGATEGAASGELDGGALAGAGAAAPAAGAAAEGAGSAAGSASDAAPGEAIGAAAGAAMGGEVAAARSARGGAVGRAAEAGSAASGTMTEAPGRAAAGPGEGSLAGETMAGSGTAATIEGDVGRGANAAAGAATGGEVAGARSARGGAVVRGAEAGSAASGAAGGPAADGASTQGAEQAVAAGGASEAATAAEAEGPSSAGVPGLAGAAAGAAGAAGGDASGRRGAGARHEGAAHGEAGGGAGVGHPGPVDEAGGGGGMGGSAGPSETEEVEEAPEPGDISMEPVAALGQPPGLTTEAPVDEPGEVVAPEAPALEGQVEGVEGQVGSGGGGVLDEIVDRALSFFRPITSRISSGLRSAASGVVSRIGRIASSAYGMARELMSSVVSGFRSLAGGILGEIRSHLGDLQAGVRGIIGQVFGAVRGVMSRIGGAIRGAVSSILAGRPVMDTLLAPFRSIFGGLFGDVVGRVRAIVERIRGVVNGAVDRLVAGAAALAARAQAGIAALGETIRSGIDWLQAESTRLVTWASELVGELPGLLRDAISGIVGRVLAFIRRVLNGLFDAARTFVQSAVDGVNALVGRAASLVTTAVNAARSLVSTAVTAVENGVSAIGGVMSRVSTWLYQKAAAGLSRVVKAIFGPIAARLQQRVLAMIGPAVGAAIQKAQLMFPNGLPAPQEIAQTVAQAAQDEAAADASAIIAGLTNPEGDHFAYGVTLGGSVGGGVGVGGAVGATLDVVLDYRRNDIGFFISPQAGGQVNVGDVSGTGNVSAVGGWGTVGNFGDPGQDVLGAYGGYFTNVTYGAQAGLAVEGGLGVSTGGSFYRGGATTGVPLFSYTPLGAGSHPVPGTGTPGTTTPGTPDRPGTMALGEVRFPRQVAELGGAPGGPSAVDHAAELALAYPTDHPSGQITGVDVLGGASRVFAHPTAGQTREAANRALADRRSQGVAEQLRIKLPGITVSAHGNGDAAAAAAGKPESDASPEDQRASMVAATMDRGAPGTTTPGTPPTQAPNQHTISGLSLPNPFQAKQAWGWDTTVGATGYGGVGAKAGVYGGAGISYSLPLGKTNFDADTMRAIRLNVGFLKLVADIASLSPLGFIRDALGLAAMSSEARSVETEIINAVTSWVIQLPPGAAVA